MRFGRTDKASSRTFFDQPTLMVGHTSAVGFTRIQRLPGEH